MHFTRKPDGGCELCRDLIPEFLLCAMSEDRASENAISFCLLFNSQQSDKTKSEIKHSKHFYRIAEFRGQRWAETKINIHNSAP